MKESARTVYCAKCRFSFQLPDFPKEIRDRVVELIRTAHPAEAHRQLKLAAGIDLQSGKAIVLHITRKKDVCNRCGGMLPAEEETICPKCNALNLNW